MPRITPHSKKIEDSKDKDKVLDIVDTEVVEIIKAIREGKERYEKEKEEVKTKGQQIRLTGQPNMTDFNFHTMSSSTPIKNSNTVSHRTETAVHFDPNSRHLIYTVTNPIGLSDWYQPPANNSIIQGADPTPGG